jgi:hypothetical protein
MQIVVFLITVSGKGPVGDTIKGKGVKIHSKPVRDEGHTKFVAMTPRKKKGSLCSKTQCTVHEP